MTEKKTSVKKPVETKETSKKEEVKVVEKKVEKAPVKKEKKETKRLVLKILNIVLWVVLFVWIFLVFSDYIRVHNEKEPAYCWFNEKTTTYSDGTVTECTGLGYKVINYKRDSFKALEFGPFWIDDRTIDNK